MQMWINIQYLYFQPTTSKNIEHHQLAVCSIICTSDINRLYLCSFGHSFLKMWQKIVVTSAAHSSRGLVYLPVACVDCFDKSQPTLLFVFLFSFSFFVLNSTTGKFIMRVTHPTSPHPLPICCCALERRGNRHWSLLPSHMHAHTPPSTSLSIDMFNVFVGNSCHFLLCHFTSVPSHLLTVINHRAKNSNDKK